MKVRRNEQIVKLVILVLCQEVAKTKENAQCVQDQ